MVLSDFLYREKQHDSNPHKITCISFNMQNILPARYYNICEREQKKYLISKRSQAKSRGITLPEVHGVDKGKAPNIRPEKTSYKAYNNIVTKRYMLKLSTLRGTYSSF